MTFLTKQMIKIKYMKSLPFIGASKPIWYIERKD